MTDDATLSEFLRPDDDAGGNSHRDTADGTTDGDTGRSTYAWGEYTCTLCDRDTDRVWREEDAFVCPDCKSW